MKKFERNNILFYALLVLFTAQCKKPYEPAVLVKGDTYLVVDGFINTSPASVTSIILTRTKNLTDTVVTIAEPGAQVSIQNAEGVSYPLHETGKGHYESNSLTLSASTQYKIVITTNANKKYQSDLVSVKPTPAIDSISWQEDSKGVIVYANTHDPANNTHFYRWQYVETYEYHSQLSTPWGVSNGLAYVRDPTQQVNVCYNTSTSNSVLLGSSAALSQDVISKAPIAKFLTGDSTLQYRASFLVTQYALSPQAYSYWQIIQKNSQQLGTLFDLQPSQLEGNFHSIDNPNEPVVGYISATNSQEKRIFINKTDLTGWPSDFGGSYQCIQIRVPVNPTNFLIIDNTDTSYAPYYFITSGPLVLAKKVCLDCTLSGGVTTKPSFW